MAHASPNRTPRTFQDLIFALQTYWSEQGCIVLQPYDMEMGAGTFHTATFSARGGPGALESGLCAAFAAAHRRTVRK